MKYKILFEVEIENDAEDIKDDIRIVKMEAEGMSRVLWANTNYPAFKVRDVIPDYEFNKRIKQLNNHK